MQENVFQAAKQIMIDKDRLAAIVIDVAQPEKSAYAIMDAMSNQGLYS